jgi:ATP10 protein
MIMHRRHFFFASLSISLFLLSAHSAAQPGQSYLKPGDILPPLAGQALTGKWLDIALVFGDNPAVVVFSFSRAGGRDAQLWTQRLLKDDPHLAIYIVIFLESVPGLFRVMAVSGIKDGIPPALQDRTILLYRDEDLWRQRLQVANERHACVMLLGPIGRVRWMTSGPFADALYLEFSKSVRALN